MCSLVRRCPLALAWLADRLVLLGAPGFGWACLVVGPLLGSQACRAESPPRGPEQTCAKVCSTTAPQCGEEACARGCNLVLDRLVEQQGDEVVACVGRAKPRCDDRAWAACAARVGAHADGGPPPPALAPDVEDVE